MCLLGFHVEILSVPHKTMFCQGNSQKVYRSIFIFETWPHTKPPEALSAHP